MKYRSTLQSHRARRNLSQSCVQRSHRRCDLIRLASSNPKPLVATERSESTQENPDGPTANC